MIIYDGKYDWQGTRETSSRPISWWASSYMLKIIDISKNRPKVHILKPIIIIVSDTGKGASAANCSENLAKSVCKDFGIDFNKMLWIDYHPHKPAYMKVAMFKPLTTIGSDTLYSVTWRPIRPNELEMIIPFVPEAKSIAEKQKA